MATFTLPALRLDVGFPNPDADFADSLSVSETVVTIETRGSGDAFFVYEVLETFDNEPPFIDVVNDNVRRVTADGQRLDSDNFEFSVYDLTIAGRTSTVLEFFSETGDNDETIFLSVLDGPDLPDFDDVDELNALVSGATFAVAGGDFAPGERIELGAAQADAEVLSDGNDKFRGTGQSDVVDAGDGNDNLNTGGGDDTIDGGAGRDTIKAGGGDDEIQGGDGNDKLSGGGGGDTIRGGADNDNIKGGGGDDLIDGGDGRDKLNGGGGGDTILGGDGNDNMKGRGGSDSLEGGDGNDTLNAGGGNDTLDGGEGDDILLGKGGFDLFLFSDGDGDDVVRGYNDSQDDLQISGVTADDLTITQQGADTLVQYDDDSILFVGVAAGVITVDDFTFV